MINRLEPGDRQLSASSWNEMRDRINNIVPSQDTVLTGNNNPFLITVKNNTSSNLDALSVVKLGTATYTRTGSTFANKGIECGTELNGVAPASESDNIAIVQGACPSGGFIRAIASGCTPAFVYKDSNKNYEYAKPVASQTGYLKGTDDPTNIRILWIASGTGKKEAYVCLDATGKPSPEYFVINLGNDGTQSATNTPTIFTKGSLHYIVYDSNSGEWVPSSYNEAPSSSTVLTRPSGARLAICQEDAPNSSAEYHMPYYTPEQNIGVQANFTSSYNFTMCDRCGVKPGEHTFTDKMWDYNVTSGTYAYEPRFTALVEVTGQTGGNNTVYVELNNEQYEVVVPNTYSGLSGANYPDIYPNDEIIVEFDCAAMKAYAIDYPTDYPEGTFMPWYKSWNGTKTYPGRGWIANDPYPGGYEVVAERVNPQGAHYSAADGGVWVENGSNVKVLIREGCIHFVEKVKTDAII